MIAYVDASVVMRRILGEPNALREWTEIRLPIASALAEVECLRTLDRLTRQGMLTEDELAERRADIFRLFRTVALIEITSSIMQRAAGPFPTPLGTLDALHLSTALAWRDAGNDPPLVATHDRALAMAARAVGLEVIGV